MKNINIPIALLTLFIIACSQNGPEQKPKQEKIGSLLTSENVVVLLPSEEHALIINDYFDNDQAWREKIYSGNTPVVISDKGGKAVNYLIPLLSDTVFFEKDMEGYWLAHTHNRLVEHALNFDVSFRKHVDTVSRMGFEYSRFFAVEYREDAEKRDQAINGYYDRKLAYLDEYTDLHQISTIALVSQWCQMIEYQRLFHLLAIPPQHRWPQEYLIRLDSLSWHFGNDALLFNPYYRRAAMQALNLRTTLEYGNGSTLQQLEATAGQLFKGKTKEYVSFSLLSRAKDKNWEIKDPDNSYEDLAARFLATAETEELKDYLQKNRLTEQLTAADAPIFNTEGKAVSLEEVLSGHSISYVDVWASWCGPCLAEMPASEQLREIYESKGVRFVYISIDEHAGMWDKVMKRIRLPVQSSFLSPAQHPKSLQKQFGIREIPRYMLFDRDGKVIDKDAPRPTHPRIRELLDKYLK